MKLAAALGGLTQIGNGRFQLEVQPARCTHVVKRELSPSEPEAVATGQRLNLHDSYDRRLVAKVKTQVVHSAGRYRSRF